MLTKRSSRIYLWSLVFASTVLTGDARTTKASPENAPLIKVDEFHLKNARYGAAAAVLGDYIYVFGGSTRGAISYMERINSRTSQVEQLSDQFLPRRYHAVIEYAGKFYLFGGQGYGLPGNPFEYAVEIYDPATNSVSRGRAMPRPRSNMAAAKLEDKAYFIGGTKPKGNNFAQTNETDIFDFTTSIWSTGLPMPTPRESRAVVVGSFLLVPGGYRSPKRVANVEMFVPLENTWKALPPLGRPVSAHSLVFLGEHLFLFGDYDEMDSILAYNLRTRESVIFNAGFKGVRHTAAVVCGKLIYVIGGTETSDDSFVSDLIQVFALNPDYAVK